MNERLFLNNQPISKPARDVSNILYGEMRKHEANRYLIYVFDEEKEFEFDQDFTIAAQERNNGIWVKEMLKNRFYLWKVKV